MRAVHGAVEDVGGDEAARGEAADEGGALPMAVRDRAVQALAARAAAVAPRHVGGGPGLVDEDQPRRAQRGLPGPPVDPPLGDVGPVLLLRPARLFLRVSPSRASVLCIRPRLAVDLVGRQQPGPQLVQRHVRPQRHLGRDRRVMVRELERLPVALRPGLGLAGRGAPAQRLVDVGHADLEQLRCRLGRAAAVDRRQHPAAQIRRIALPRLPRHRTTSAHCNREV